MSQSWLSRLRDRNADPDGDWAETGHTIDLDAEISADESGKPRGPRRWGTWLLRVFIGLAVVGWVGIVAWSFVDPEIGLRIAPFLEIVSRLSVPLVLVVGVAILVTMLAGHWDNDPQPEAGLNSEEARDAAAQAARAAARIAEAHGQLVGQTKAYAAEAERSAAALQDAVVAMAEKGDKLSRSTTASIGQLGKLAERMTNLEDVTPRLERRISELTETLTVLSVELRERTIHLETRLKEAANAAGETREELISAGNSLADQMTAMREGTRAAGEELASISELNSARIDLTLDRVKTVMNTTQQRIDAQNEALDAMVAKSRTSIENASRSSLDGFLAHCRDIEATLDTLDQRIETQSQKGTAWLQSAASSAATLAEQFDTLESSALNRTERLGTAMMELSAETRRLTDALEAGDASSDHLIKRAEALLLALDSGIRELDESVPAAIGRVDERIAGLRERIADTAPGIESIEAIATAVTGRLEESGKLSTEHAALLDRALERSRTALGQQRDQITALSEAVSQASETIAALGEKAGPQLVETLSRVRETANAAAEKARQAIEAVIPQAAGRLGAASSEAVQDAMAQTVDAQLGRLAQAAQTAVATATEAANALDGQIKALQSSSTSLERRLATASEQVDAQDRELLTKRSGELIEMLNSRAIDVSKWLGHDISQSEWSAYLKGDKGIFARRAVNLLTRGDARAVRSLYKEDSEFADHVNRYVHDFETLLKSVLETRDGSALAVTMVSSDLGKLYVALAQASERLRT